MIYFRYNYPYICNFTLIRSFIYSIFIHLATEEKLTDTFHGRRGRDMTETMDHKR